MIYLLQHALDQSVSKSEGSSGKRVENVGVDSDIVLVVVAIGDRENVQLCHVVCAQDQGQPFIVSDVL